jgi:hypothetical protein
VIDLVKQIDKQISFNVFSRKCGSHIQDDDGRCFCDEVSEEHTKNCNLNNCPLYPKIGE